MRGRSNSPPASAGPAQVLRQLQQTAGNAATQALLSSGQLQAKLRIGPADDEREREADQVAEAVVGTDATLDLPHADPRADAVGKVQRKCSRCEEEETLRRKASGGRNAIPQAAPGDHGGGRPLSPEQRAYYEPRFGHDFREVRVHTGPDAAASAASINARAFTHGSNVVFGSGEYRPDTMPGQKLLAHELTHVVQQESIRVETVQRQAGPPAAGGLSPAMLAQIARRLHEAMSGWGTDEEAVYAALSGRSQDQVDAIEQKFNEMYDPDLQTWLSEELTRIELLRLGLQSQAAALQPADRARSIAIQLRDAMEGWGTDESAIFAALTGRTSAERAAIAAAYNNLTQRNLLDDLKDELSGAELREAVALFNQGVLKPADELYLATAGLGTDEDRITRVLSELSPAEITQMDADYRAKYGDLVADLRGDLSQTELAPVMGVLEPVIQNAAFESCNTAYISVLRARMPLVKTKVDRAITVLSAGWSNMSAADQSVFNQYFDPSGSGGVDAQFVAEVVLNFRRIKQEISGGVTFECEGPGGSCSVSGRYGYTYFSNIHICPHFWTMTPNDQSWGILHELTHNALMAVDRNYSFEPGFSSLTPRGNIGNRIPIVGPLIQLIARDDTLFNPDSYAHFAFKV